jgi:hypothetical protein
MSAIATMKKTVSCGCGAVYERTEEKLTFRDIDTFECRCCGTTLESWSRSRIPVVLGSDAATARGQLTTPGVQDGFARGP